MTSPTEISQELFEMLSELIDMDPLPSSKSSTNLFQVYLRLRPQSGTGTASHAERFLTVEERQDNVAPTHIILNPPNDRRRAVEKFAFTQVFEEDASQLDVFHCTGVAPLVEGVLAPHGGDGTDALLATLGVTGSGKTHTILGSRTQRGMTQLALDVIFRSLGANLLDVSSQLGLESSIQTSDPSEAVILHASVFLESVYGDSSAASRAGSRAATPMIVGSPAASLRFPFERAQPYTPLQPKPNSVRLVIHAEDSIERKCLSEASPEIQHPESKPATLKAPKRAVVNKHFMSLTTASKNKNMTKTDPKGEYPVPPTPRRLLQRPSCLPQSPDISSINVSSDPSAEYAVVISMYEVYNDRIYDLLTQPIKSNATKEYRRRPLLFKSTELSPDRKVVAGLRKIICGSLKDALMVLEAGLHERRIAGTGSNSVSSRSHGFFCIEVKKRRRSRNPQTWSSSTLTVVDLAGSERARDAKTQGATLAEAGKINESLMYLGQCLQMQSDAGGASKPSVVPFRQCKLTELLFSNSFPSHSVAHSVSQRRNPQKAVMIVTADPLGDFNATSQILRYSTLAREVTVPRIPSITQTILANVPTSPPIPSCPISPVVQHYRPFFPPGSGTYRSFSPPGSHDGDRATMELAALEIARMSEEIDILRGELAHESEARMTAEAHLLSMEDRLLDLEQCVREDCVAEFETRLAVELARWKTSLAVEQERGEEHWDRKIEVMERGLGFGIVVTAPGDEDEDKENILVENLEQENERLRREVLVLKRELAGRSPSRRMPLQERDDFAQQGEVGSLDNKMARLSVSNESIVSTRSTGSTGSPKKMKKLGTKRWEEQDDAF